MFMQCTNIILLYIINVDIPNIIDEYIRVLSTSGRPKTNRTQTMSLMNNMIRLINHEIQ